MIKNVLFVFITFISFTVKAQDPRLPANTWYLTELQINGTTYSPPSTSIIPEIQFNISNTGLYQTEVCSGTAIVGQATFIGTNSFEVTSQAQALGTCGSPDPIVDAMLQNFNAQHNTFWIIPGQQVVIHNYTIQSITGGLSLIITNRNGDIATYSNVPTASVDDISLLGFTLFPNPTNDILNIQYDKNRNPVSLVIYDIAGRRLISTNSTLNTIATSSLTSGNYVLQVTYDDGSGGTQRFIKN